MNFINIIDKNTYQFLADISSNNLTNFLLLITNMASAVSFITITIIFILILKNRKESLFITLNLVLVFLLNLLLKNIFARERPGILPLVIETGFSFPSAHSMVSIAYYGFLIYLINLKFSSKKKYVAIGLIGLLIILIGTSRIYLGVHYATDVLGGFLIGFIYLICIIYIYNKFIKEKDSKTEENK